MLGLDLDSWNDVMVISLAIGALAAAVVGGATFAVIRLQKVESIAAKNEFDTYRLAVSADIAAANERAAEANKIAEGERLARTKLEEKIRPRVITPEQEAVMQAILKGAPKGLVYINPDWVNPEAKIFAAHIASVLERAGYNLDKLKGDSAPLSYGKLGAFLVIKGGSKQPPHLKPIHDALKAIGYDFLVYEEAYVPEGAVLVGISAK